MPLFSGLDIGDNIPSSTSGSILFADSNLQLAQDNTKLFFDNANDRLGVGTNSPASTIEAMCGSATEIGLIIQGAASQSADLSQWMDSAGNSRLEVESDFTMRYAATNETISATKGFFKSVSVITCDNILSNPSFFSSNNTFNYTTSPAFAIPPFFFNFQSTISAQGNISISQPVGFYYLATINAGNGFTWTGADNNASFFDAPTLNVTGTGSFSTLTINSFRSQLTVSSGIASKRRGIYILNATGAGTLTDQVGIQIDDLVKGGTSNIPVYVKGTTGKSRHQPQIKFGADSDPAVDVDVNGWILYAGTKRVSTQFDKSADTTLANITGLSVTTVAGRTYRFNSILFVDSSTLGGYKFAVSGTTTATAIVYNINVINNTTNAYTITSRQTAMGGSSGAATGTSEYAEISGLITVSSAGTLTLQFAQNVSNGTSSVLVGSVFEVWDIA